MSLANILLPQHEGPSGSRAKAWIGEGLPAVPSKLRQHILNWEYIDIAELRPLGSLEALSQDTDPQRLIITENFELTKVRKKPIRDILTWVQAFAVYIAVVSQQFPEAVPELIAYMLFIIKKAPQVEDQVWLVYDLAFREKAAATGNRTWSKTDSTLCDQIFAGRAKKLPLCTQCFSTAHDTVDCPGPGQKLGQHRAGQDQAEDKVRLPGKPMQQKVDREGDRCRRFNAGNCSYNPCKYRHMCMVCSGRHEAIQCPHRDTPHGRQVLERLMGPKQPRMMNK